MKGDKKIMTKLFTNEKETKRAIKAAVNQANKVKTHCAICGCTPKPDEWSAQVENCCFDCA
jgi:recombinational DNA repair protein RecR